MTGLAFALVFAAAFIHAGWNVLAKRSSGGVAFIFLINALSTLLYTPIAVGVFIVQKPSIETTALILMLGSAIIHIGYFLILQRGYQVGDLSLVYPLARGTGPVLSATIAIAVLGERPTAAAIAGIGLITGGVILLTGNPRKFRQAGTTVAIAYGLLTGAFIAFYTIWDKIAVSQFNVSPVLLNYGCSLFEAVLLFPIALHHWQRVRDEWTNHPVEVLGVAVLSPLAYILVLIAMVSTPVSHVAPIREFSILIGTVMGTRLLAEKNARHRTMAASIMVLGVVLLALN